MYVRSPRNIDFAAGWGMPWGMDVSPWGRPQHIVEETGVDASSSHRETIVD